MKIQVDDSITMIDALNDIARHVAKEVFDIECRLEVLKSRETLNFIIDAIDRAVEEHSQIPDEYNDKKNAQITVSVQDGYRILKLIKDPPGPNQALKDLMSENEVNCIKCQDYAGGCIHCLEQCPKCNKFTPVLINPF